MESDPLNPRVDSHRGRFLISCAVAAGLTLLAGLLLRVNWLTDWDSYDYTCQAVRGRSSDLLLGRWWFIFFMRVAWWVGGGVFGLSELNAFRAMQWANLAAMCLAVVGLMAWTRRLTGHTAVSLLAGGIVVLSPLTALYATAVMTEPIALATLAWALYAWQRAGSGRAGTAWALLAGGLFGVAVDVREPALLLAAWPVLACIVYRRPGRWRRLALGAAAMAVTLGVGMAMAAAWRVEGGLGYWANIVDWTQVMAEERQRYLIRYPLNGALVIAYLGLAVPAGALVLAAAGAWAAERWRRRRGADATAPPASPTRLPPAAWAAAAAVPYAVSLLVNHNLSFNFRFALPLGWMLTPLAACLLARGLGLRTWPWPWPKRWQSVRLRLAAVALGGALLAVGGGIPLGAFIFRDARDKQVLCNAMLHLPDRSVVAAGKGTPVAAYLVNMDIRPDFEIIWTGWDFPHGTLNDVVAEALAAGRPVYVNADGEHWERALDEPLEWRAIQKLLAAYPPTEADPATAPLVPLAAPTTRPATGAGGSGE